MIHYYRYLFVKMKVFNYSELHFFKGTFYKIHTLAASPFFGGRCQQTFENKKFVEITQLCFALLPQVNFPANNLNFH